MKYPEYAEVNGVKYKINTSYRVGIKCFEVINDPKICDEERALAVIYLLFGDIPDGDYTSFLKVADKYLTCGKDGSDTPAKRDVDFVQDEPYIMASFLSDYGLDLAQKDMHFWQYVELIGGLTEGAVLSRIREIRNFDMAELTDPKQRRKMADAKQSFALKEQRTAEQQKAIEDFESLFKG